MHVGLVRAGVEIVDAFFPQALFQVGDAVGVGFCVELPEFWVVGIDLDKFSRLGVFEGDPAYVGDFVFPGIGQEDAGEVVPAAGQAKDAEGVFLGLVFPREEVAEEEDDGFAPLDLVEVLEGGREVCPLPFRLEKENFADEAEDVLAAFGRADEFLDPVCK